MTLSTIPPAPPTCCAPVTPASDGLTLEALRQFVLQTAHGLDPKSRYVGELLQVLDSCRSLDDYLARLSDRERAEQFRRDYRRSSGGERGFSWVDGEIWTGMDVFERTLANLLTGETRMMWAEAAPEDFTRFAEAVGGMGPALS